MKFFAALTLAALAVVGASAQTPVDQPSREPDQFAFNKVERIGEPTGRSFFVFSTEGRNYTIRHDGHSEVSATKVLRRNFDLRMGLVGRLESFYFLEHEGDLLLLYETTDGKQTRAFLERMDPSTLKVRWLIPIPAHHVGPALVVAEEGYLVSEDLFAKVNLHSGSYLWQTSLEETNETSSVQFMAPRMEREKVLFQEDAENGRTFEVNKETGKILRIIPPKQ